MKHITLETIQYRKLLDIDDVAPISDKDHTVLAEIREVIARHDYFDRFGITLLHKHFDIQQDEMLIENTDVENRRLTLTVEPVAEPTEKTIETLWRFRPASDPVAGTVCKLRCNYNSGHRRYHNKEAT